MNAENDGREAPAGTGRQSGSAAEVFLAFLKLGVTSFGGPIAHLGYFRNELVNRRKWLDEAGYAELVALSQFLPGPASSQTGFALGVLRAGLPGGLAAWAGFTLPSALVLVIFALIAPSLQGEAAEGALHGLRLVAVAVVAQAVWGMARKLTPDRQRAGIALVAVGLVIVDGGGLGQIGAILLGALAGLWLCRSGDEDMSGNVRFPVSRRAGAAALTVFAVLLAGMPWLAALTEQQAVALFSATYKAGALVFGGGHVVLPLLQNFVVAPGWVGSSQFLDGYGLAQAIPGPLFTFAAYLGAVSGPAPNGFAGAAIALAGIFLPGLLLVYGMLPFWDRFRHLEWARAAMRGTNAAVVGILGAALYDPVWVSAVRNDGDFVMAVAGFLLLTVWRMPPWVVVVLLAVLGAAAAAPFPAPIL